MSLIKLKNHQFYLKKLKIHNILRKSDHVNNNYEKLLSLKVFDIKLSV